MESRYALRELEGVIGIDTRRLEDGRKAVFRHTFIHRKIKRDFFERRDAITVLNASMIAYAVMGTRGELSLKSALETLSDSRRSLSEAVFPYLDMKERKSGPEAGVYDEYFDELDAIEEAKAKAEECSGGAENGTEMI